MSAASTSSVGQIKLFTRASSGLVRELGFADTAWYGVLAAGGLFAFVFLFPTPQFVSPGINIPLMLVFTLLYGMIIYFVYAALGSAMPRAGGDYLYESRSIHPVVGFTVPWACQLLFWLAFPAAGAYVVSTFGLVPIAAAAGADGLVTWLVSKNGTFVVAAIVIVGCWVLTVFGLRVYRAVQRYVLVPGILISTVTIIILLLVNLGTDFAAKFAAYHNGAITTASVQAAAQKAGYHAFGLNIPHTMIWVAVLAAYVPYTMYSAQGLLGEVKGARSLWRLFSAFLTSGVLVAIILLAIPFFLLTAVAGNGFLNQYAWAYGSGGIAPAYVPNVSVFFAMLTSNVWLTVLTSIGFITGGFGIANVVFVNSARVMMAMGLDRSLPKLFADVSDRFHTPVKAATIWSVCALGVAAAFSYRPDWETVILVGGAITSVIVVGVTCLGAVVFPYRSPEIFASAPAAKYRVGRVPALTLVGAAGTILTGLLVWVALTDPALGLTSTAAHVAIGGAFLTGLIVYIAMRLYVRKEGVDTSLAFRQVPPE